jgi:hypothetical protein
MNLAAVAREIDERMKTLPSLVAHYLGQGVKSVTPPCSVVPLPDIDYNQTYRGGVTRIPEWEIAILAGKVDDLTAFDRLGIYADTTGDDSVIAALQDGEPYTACDVITVVRVTFDVITWQGQDFQGALFTLDVAGR